MQADREQSAEQLFGAALELTPEQRTAFLDEACRETPELRRQVDALLREHQSLGGSLDGPTFASGRNSASASRAPGQAMLPAGAKLGRYTIRGSLGAGGMGVVYRAFDEQLERAVAIKILSPGLLRGDEAQQRFRRESLVLAKLSHAHIAAVYDAGRQDGVDYIVMECVPGESLATKLKTGALPLKESTQILVQIAQALEEAHEHGVIHRDLKPANVMITPKGQVKVLDFGIAKLIPSLHGDATLTIPETQGLVGTPLYMSPEQAHGQQVDARTDLWNLGVIYYELLTGRAPFRADNQLAILRAITDEAPAPLPELQPDLMQGPEKIVARALEKEPAKRYQTAAEVVADASEILAKLSGTTQRLEPAAKTFPRILFLVIVLLLLGAIGASVWFYHRTAENRWAREEAVPQINKLLADSDSLAAFLVLEKAQRYLPTDPQLAEIARDQTSYATITSSPSGATVEIADYTARGDAWHSLGTTPLNKIRIPKGYFRWRVSKPGAGVMITAPVTDEEMDFDLASVQQTPAGMVYSPAGSWTEDIGFIGWIGPYKLPAYYADRYEVTNREYQKFVDGGGYEKQQYWTHAFTRNGKELRWTEAMAEFRDTTGRAGPANWVGGHYPEGKGDYPVSGVSWFEASAYAAFAGKSLPVVAQWFQLADPGVAGYAVSVSNISGNALAPVGLFKGIGPLGTYDMAGNVREWVVNAVDNDLRFILGGSWRSPTYLYYCPEALSPFDRSDTNGFRTVRNLGALPEQALQPIRRDEPDFTKQKPISDDVYHAYQVLYAYPQSPLNAKDEGVVKETADWREEKISFDTAYNGERMSAYLYLPKNARPPYQTVLFFPSARVQFLPNAVENGDLGDTKFFDYIVQSGRAVMYPIYQDTYERRAKFFLPQGSQSIELTTEWYKDAARSLDYLATRPDIDNGKLAYLGVSMGSAYGVILGTLMQERLKTAVFLDGGYFLDPPTPGASQADFAPRFKKPVLMVNGRYDFTFSLEKSQNPMFAMLGAPAADKQHLVLDTPHDVTERRPELVKAVLDWLDRYMGRVSDQAAQN